jgi:transmembrane sensor
MSEYNFHKILNNSATEPEKQEFYSLLENDPELREEFYSYKNLYTVTNLNPENYLLQQSKLFNIFWDRIHNGKNPKLINIWMRYAAIFIVASILGFMGNYVLDQKTSENKSQHIVYNSEKGSVSAIHFEDGSSIWLSSGTELVIDRNKNGETIAQLSGEAFFDLIPDSKRKFVVDLGQFLVRDIGTTFNIRAYKAESSITTTLIKGQIDLIKNSGESLLSVKEGELVKYDKDSKEMVLIQKDPSIVTAWRDGKFVFIDQPLSEICKELENWYNVEIQIEDQKLANTRYTSVVKRSTTVKMVLKILSVTDQIKYTITDKEQGKDLIRIKK